MKKVVITGGNSGIGKSIAKKFDSLGDETIIFGRNKKRLDKTVSELNHCTAIQGDVSKLQDLRALFAEVGSFDVLIANAGISGNHALEDITEEVFDEMVDINYKGLFFTVKYGAPHINSGGSVVLISSIAAHRGLPHLSIYCSTKAAVSSLAKSFAAALIEKDVRVNAISPGYIDTPIFDTLRAQAPQALENKAQRVPSKRFGLPEEIADAAYFLTTQKYIVGEDIVIDGGLLPCIIDSQK